MREHSALLLPFTGIFLQAATHCTNVQRTKVRRDNLRLQQNISVVTYPQSAQASFAERERTPNLNYLLDTGRREYTARLVVSNLIDDRSVTPQHHMRVLHPRLAARWWNFPHV